MTPRAYLEPETNYTVTPLPAEVSQRAAEFEERKPDAEILTVYHIEHNHWQFAYAVDRGTKRHAEYMYHFTVQA